MPVLLIVEPQCTLTGTHAAPWWVTMNMLTGQTGRQTDARRLRYAFRYGCGQRNKQSSLYAS